MALSLVTLGFGAFGSVNKLPTLGLYTSIINTPAAPSDLTATAASSSQIDVAWTDNAADVTGANEVQTVTFGTTPSAGIYTLTFDGETTGNLDYDADAATIQAALEATAAFEVGDVAVDKTGNAITLTYQGGLAAMSLPEITANGEVVALNYLVSAAGTIDVTVTQSGIESVNEVQFLDLDGATSGSYVLELSAYNTPSIDYDADAATIQSALEGLGSVGSGNVSVASNGDGYDITFQGSLAGTDISQLVVYNSTDASPSVSTTTQGAGRPHIFTIALSDSPTEGSLKITKSGDDSSTWAHNASAASVEAAIEAISGGYACSVTGDSGGPWTVTSDAKIAAPTWTASEVDPLLKGVSINIATTTQGSPQSWAALGTEVHRSTDGSSYSLLVDLGANMESWPDDELPGSTLFYYRVRAYNAGGYSDWSNVDSDTTDAEEDPSPSGGIDADRLRLLRPL